MRALLPSARGRGTNNAIVRGRSGDPVADKEAVAGVIGVDSVVGEAVRVDALGFGMDVGALVDRLHDHAVLRACGWG